MADLIDSYSVVFLTNFNEEMRHSHSELFGVGKIDVLIRSMSISTGTENTESDDEGLWVQGSKLGQERD